MLTSLFILLLLGGLGFPMPEEIPLFIGGVLVSHGEAPLELAFLVCYAGVLIGDQTMYTLGYFFGHRILDFGTKSPYLPAVTEARVNEVRDGLRRKQLVYLFVGRHLFVLRSVTFVVAGSLRIPFVEFFIADAIAALFSVTLFMGLGYAFAGVVEPEVITSVMRRLNWVIIGIVLLAGVFVLLKRRK
jgi:membrane protein DedA with SNARE-associated domain